MVLTAATVLFAATLAGAQTTPADQARGVFEKNKDSVLWVTAVVKLEFSAGGGRSLGPPRESKVQIVGTIVDPCGMTVVALSAIDPGSAFQGRKVTLPSGENVQVTAKSSHSEVKLVLADGTEIAARIVLTDSTLDLAFVCPEKADEKVKYEPVKMDAAEPKVLEQMVCLGRMSKSLGQAPGAAMSEVTSIVDSPRRFYIGGRTPGAPCFTLDGKLIGICATYMVQLAGQDTGTLVIVPTKDLVKGVKEAMTKKDEPVAVETPAPKEAPKEAAKDASKTDK